MFFQLTTTDINNNIVNFNAPGLSLSTTQPNTFIDWGYSDVPVNSELGASGAEYEFTILTHNPVPSGGYLTVTVPSSVTLSAQSTLKCMAGCAITENSVVEFDDATRTFTLTGGFEGGFLDFFSLLQIRVTGITSPNNYNGNSFTISTYDDLNPEFAIDQGSFAASPVGVLTFTKAKKRNFSRTNYIMDFTADRDIPTSAIYQVTFGGDLVVAEQEECFLKASPNVDWGCAVDVANNTFYVFMSGTDAEVIAAGDEIEFIIGDVENNGSGSVTIDIVSTSLNSMEFFYEHLLSGSATIE